MWHNDLKLAYAAAGISFTTKQRAWLDAIRNHIAKSLGIEPDDFDEVLFSQVRPPVRWKDCEQAPLQLGDPAISQTLVEDRQ